MIQNLLNYNSFVRDRIFQHLIDIYNKKMNGQDIYWRVINEIIEQVQNKANAIEIYMKQHAKNHKELQIYSQIFRQVKKELQNQANQLRLSKQQHQKNYIYLLESCKLSLIANQKSIIEFAQRELASRQKTVIYKVKQVRQKEEQIQTIKKQSFCYMLSILNELDNDLIKEKYQQKQSQKSFKFYGSKRKQMNQMYDQIIYLQQEGKQKLKEIASAQQQRIEFINKICQKLNSIQSNKINLLLKICNQFRHQPQSMNIQVNYLKDVYFNQISKPIFQNRQFLQHYRKSTYILLNPHPKNQLLIQHRQSLAKKVSNSSLKDNRNAYIYGIDLSLDFQVGDYGKQGVADYEGYLQFLQTIRNTLGSSYLSEGQLDSFMQYFKNNLRKKPLRQVFLFYLYQLGKVNTTLIGLILKDSKILIEMINLLLTTCLDYYDTQSTIKILMLIYHINLPEQVELYQTIRSHKIWKSFQFWETSFLQSVYEYFQMIIIYYHQSIDQYVSSKAEDQQTNHWFLNIFKGWQTHPTQKKKKDQINIAKEFYYEIVKNLALIYLSNMILMVVPGWIIQKFKKNVLFIYQKLNFKIQFYEEFKRLIEVVGKKDEKDLKKLLQDDNVLEKIMSKLIGGNGQKSSVPLSKSIADWISQK